MGHRVLGKRTRLTTRSRRRLSRWKAATAAGSFLAVSLTTAGEANASGHITRPEIRAVCPVTAATFYRPGRVPDAVCEALIRTGELASSPSGYGPADLQSAYKLTQASRSRGKGQTVAIVDAYNDPDAATDLAVYRKYYKLPACTMKNGCFRQVNQDGKTSPLPADNSAWALEESLDMDMVSAICPNCHILLVEADKGTMPSLGAAEDTAAAMGAAQISNSWIVYGNMPDSEFGHYWNHPGHISVFGAGDDGYGVGYPATSYYVTAVGGTTLTRTSGTRGWAETVWSGTGSGCSTDNTKPPWQKAASLKDTGCAHRTDVDVAADANLDTGVAIYDSYPIEGESGWIKAGGTSEATPIISGVYALAGNAAKVRYASYPYAHISDLFDITQGSNGTCTSPAKGKYLCTARVGYDGPTGLGTPDGYQGF